ncbi:MAG: immunoglobulin domain-containing protein, partial [Opitutales bacterium]
MVRRPFLVLAIVWLVCAGFVQAQSTITLNNTGQQSFAFDPVDHFLYSSQQGSGSSTLTVINTLTNTVTGSITFSAGLASQTSASGTTVFVPDQSNHFVRVFSISSSGVPSALRTDPAHYATGSAALTTTYAVTKQGTGDYMDINLVSTGANQHTTLVGGSAGLVFSDANTNRYYADYASGAQVIDAATGNILRGLSGQVQAVDSSSAHNFVYTAAGTVLTQLSGTANTPTATYDFGASFGAVTVDPATGDVYVALQGQNKVVHLNSSLAYVGQYSVTAPWAAAVADGQLYVQSANVGSLTVIAVGLPVITTAPGGQTVNAGSSASFTVAATSGTTLTYQWYLNSVAISGATAATYSISSVQTSDAGSYTVAVTNSVGTTTSTAVILTVNVLPIITTPPVASQTVDAGNAVSFTVAASGVGSLTYQWYKGGVAISGATGSTYTIYSPQAGDAGIYTVAVTDSTGTALSSAATLTVNVPALVSIAVTPANPAVNVGAQQAFTATGTFSDSTTQVLNGFWAGRGPLTTTRASA